MADYQVKVAGGDAVVQQPTQTSDAENYVLNLDHEEVKSKALKYLDLGVFYMSCDVATFWTSRQILYSLII